MAAQTSRDVQVAGLGGIPTTDVLAVVLDLTVYNNNSGAWGILWQAGTTRPYPASSINYVPGRVVTNSVTTKVGAAGSAAGKVSFFSWEATDMLIDVVGYYRTAPGGGGYVPLTQARVLDTAGAKIPANSSIDRKLRGVAGVPDSTAVTAVVMNATVHAASGPGPLTVWPKGLSRPDTSVMNYSPVTARTAMVTATLSADGWASIWTWASIDLIIDVAGYYTTGSGSTFVPLTPKRIVDTRYNGTRYNNNPNWGIGPVTQYLAPNTTTAIKVTGTGGVPETAVGTVILNVVADAATTATSSQIGFLTVWASGDAQPGILTMSYYGAESASNLVMAKVGADGKINIYNYYASTELIVDVVGYFTTGTGPGAPTNVIAAPADQAAALAWGPPASDGGTAIAGYLVKVYKTTPTLTYLSETTTCATCTSTTLTGLMNGQSYRFEVSARNSLGYGPSATSNVVTPNMTTTTSTSTTTTVPPTTTTTAGPTTTTTVPPTTTTTVPPTTTTTRVEPLDPPLAPLGTVIGPRTARVSWTRPIGNDSPVVGYSILVTPSCPSCDGINVSGNPSEAVITGLSPFGSPYTFVITARNERGQTSRSVPSPALTIPPDKYAAMGDSYSSGEGTANDAGECQRSPSAYGPYWAEILALVIPDLTFTACTGSTTEQLLATQLPTVPTDAALITLTVGGNDVGFGDIIRRCLGIQFCNVTFGSKEEEINEFKSTLVRTYRVVLDHARDARVVVLSYPQVLSDDPDDGHCLGEGTLENGERSWIRDRTAQMEQVIRAAIVEINDARLSLLPVLNSFEGHEVCSNDGEYANGFSGFEVSNSFHPNVDGQMRLAEDLESHLASIGWEA